MIEIVDNFLDKYSLKDADNTFLVGFSGGCDSLCLLDVFNILSKKYGYRLVALHLNHNWRGEESKFDEMNCRRFCEHNSIEFISETLPEGGQKTENAAREARYKFFLDYAKRYENSSIFTAHTRSDNAETVVYRIIKGTGIQGLQGILPKRMVEDSSGAYPISIPVYRPLLSVSRHEIEGYCISKGLVANNDASNFDVSYKRNFIRHKILPLFKEINFGAEKAIVSLAGLALNQNKIVEEYLKLIKADIYADKKILTEKFRNLSEEVMLKVIYDGCLTINLDYDYKKVVNILDFIKSNFDSKAGSVYSLAGDLWLFANYKYIYLINKIHADENAYETSIDAEGEYDILGNGAKFLIQKYSGPETFKFPPENANIAYVRLDNLSNLTVRTRRKGDFISPFGMKGTMKLKKYLNAKGVLKHERDGLVLLCKDSEVLWVVGVGLSDKLKVVNKPTHVIQLNQ